jgi:hypothetical protein
MHCPSCGNKTGWEQKFCRHEQWPHESETKRQVVPADAGLCPQIFPAPGAKGVMQMVTKDNAGKVNIADLEIKPETVSDLAENDLQNVKGGIRATLSGANCQPQVTANCVIQDTSGQASCLVCPWDTVNPV